MKTTPDFSNMDYIIVFNDSISINQDSENGKK